MTRISFSAKLTAAALSLFIGVCAWAQATPEVASTVASSMASGEVRKVDKDAGKITLKHGDIKSLDMPPMTMVFTVRDPKLLDALKPGDKVKFAAERREGAFVVTAIERAAD